MKLIWRGTWKPFELSLSNHERCESLGRS